MFAELPPDLPDEKLQPLIEELKEQAQKIGLYVSAVALNVDHGDPDETDPDAAVERRHQLMMQFTLGSQAFSNRVQDPESDNFDTEFKKIESGALQDNVSDIVEQLKDPSSWLEEGEETEE